MTIAWWSDSPPPSGDLTREMLVRGYNAVLTQEEYCSPALYLHPSAEALYRKMLARMRWEKEYRAWRMFRKACEMGWMNVRHTDF